MHVKVTDDVEDRMETTARAEDRDLILVTGATGYIGGRLVPRLAAEGLRVRCLARRPEAIAGRFGPGVQVVGGDVLRPETLGPAMEGVSVAYYLVHAMGSSGRFAEAEVRAAREFGRAARAAGVRRIVYLGGLADDRAELSEHLRSRAATGEALRESGVETVEFRASIVIGSGSFSFEMVRALVDRLPLMITPRWVRVRTQPIAVEDVIDYLAAARDVPLAGSRIIEIGGAQAVTYGALMREYARQRGMRRVMIPVPVLTPALSSLWLLLVTPAHAAVGRHLVEGLRNETVVRDGSAREVFPAIRPRTMAEAIQRALVNEDQEMAATRWADALHEGVLRPGYGGARLGSRLVDARACRVPVPPAQAFAPIRRIGGETGWYYGEHLWWLRGLVDQLSGGVGLRRGRRDPENLGVGDTVDWWRVEAVEPDRLLRLRAEMRVPGRAWLEFEVKPDGGGSRIYQTAVFDPRGALGRAYWYALWPVHQVIFAGMMRNIARAGVAEPAPADAPSTTAASA